MKTVEELYKEKAESRELQEELRKTSLQEEGEIEDDDAKAAVGGIFLRPAPPSPLPQTTVP